MNTSTSECATLEYNGKKIVLEPNRMNISEMTFSFGENGGKLEYVNKTGQKTIKFYKKR